MVQSRFQRGKALAELIRRFPDADPVQRISDKMVSFKGYYPRRPLQSEPGSVVVKNQYLHFLATELFPDCHIFQEQQLPVRLQSGIIERHEFITSEQYRSQALNQLTHDYPNVWKSSIRAVMAENNSNYLKSFDQLAEMGSGGFWLSIRNLLKHWSSSATSSTAHASVDKSELAEELNIIKKRRLDEQERTDIVFATSLNDKEYAATGAYISCECCFDDCTFEQLQNCSTGEHLFCKNCIERYLSEGIFGQGNLRGVSPIACMNSSSDCEGIFARHVLEATLSSHVWKAYELSLTKEEVSRSASSIVQCPFCDYCEIDDHIRPLSVIQEYTPILVFCIACILELPVAFILATWFHGVAAYVTLLAVHISVQWMLHFADWRDQIRIVYKRIQDRHRGKCFQCRNPKCGKISCLLCSKAVNGLHSCTDDAQDAYRLYVEKAMADAVKRTCPICNLSFQKSDGCNKMTCLCGYNMCYVCRKDIGKESYSHFCQHFREVPGRSCAECSKCDLYKTESDDSSVRAAARKARKEYLAAHPEVLQHMDKADVPTIGPPTATEAIHLFRKLIHFVQFKAYKRTYNSFLSVY
ncbi:unnamed protein product [Umbelopsis ramanniana]